MAKKKATKPDELLAEIRENIELGIDAFQESIDSWQENIAFENGDQWEDAAQKDREANSRPCITINKVYGALKQITGEQRQSRNAINVRPVDDQSDPQVAEIYNGLIRNIENTSKASEAYDLAFEHAVGGGFGAFRVLTDYSRDDAFDQDIIIRRITNPCGVIFDPSALDKHKRDARWAIVGEWVNEDAFEEQYPDCESPGEWSYDFGKRENWTDGESVLVVEYFWKKMVPTTLYLLADGRTVKADSFDKELVPQMQAEGFIVKERKADIPEVHWCKACATKILEGPQKWAGKHIPLIFVPGDEAFVDGKQIYRSAVTFAKDPQRLYNWARSIAVETMAMAPRAPFVGTAEAVEGYEADWDNANRTPKAILLYNQGQEAPQRQQPTIPDTGAFQEMMAAADDIKATTGIYDASLGARSNETSGKAILSRQKQGDTATYHFQDNLASAVSYCGEILVDLIPKIYDTEKVVRLLNEDGSEAWAKINQTVPTPQGEMVINDLSQGKYDVVVKTGPQFVSKRQEAAEQMVALMQAVQDPAIQAKIIPRLVKNLDWPEADQIAAELSGQPVEGQEQDPQAQQQIMQAQQAQQQQMQAQQEAMQMQHAAQQMELQKLQLELEAAQIANASAAQKMEIDAAKAQQDMEIAAQKAALETHKHAMTMQPDYQGE